VSVAPTQKTKGIYIPLPVQCPWLKKRRASWQWHSRGSVTHATGTTPTRVSH